MYIQCGINHVMNGKATHKQHMERDTVRYGKTVLSHESSLLFCCQVGGRPSVSQTWSTQNQANSAPTSSLIISHYHQFQISWPKTKLMAVTPNLTNHLPMKICNMEVQFVDSFTYLGSLIMNDSAMYGLSNPLCRKHRISIRTKINIQYIAPWLSPFCWMALKHGLPPSPIAAA